MSDWLLDEHKTNPPKKTKSFHFVVVRKKKSPSQSDNLFVARQERANSVGRLAEEHNLTQQAHGCQSDRMIGRFRAN